MKIFLSAVENNFSDAMLNTIISGGGMLYNLMSFYYITKGRRELVVRIRDNSKEILIDSGAHSFQFGKKVDWIEYTKKYAEFIKDFDRPNVIGYFEMDIENIIGYDKVKDLRRILENASDKIIPVWHPPRGIQDFKDMCAQYAGKIIAIGGFRGTDIKDEQFLMFLKYAKKHRCKVHCLGMTRTKVLDKVPFDFTDSSSWIASTNFGKVLFGEGQLPKAKGNAEREKQRIFNYKQGMKMQEHYHRKWQKECQD
jgi:hypothetical protein